MPERTSRIAEARRRAADTKQAAVAFAAAGFLAIALLARVSHPAHASSRLRRTGDPGVDEQVKPVSCFINFTQAIAAFRDELRFAASSTRLSVVRSNRRS